MNGARYRKCQDTSVRLGLENRHPEEGAPQRLAFWLFPFVIDYHFGVATDRLTFLPL